MDALMRANLDALELSVGNDNETVGLLTAWPAATLALKDWMKDSRSGGQEQGILMGTPCAFGMPSQSPVPVGFKPAARPNCGTRAGSTPPAAGDVAAGDVAAGAAGLVVAGAAVPA